MDIIKNRIVKLKSELNKFSNDREKNDYLLNYYKNKTAFIIATGPGFTDHIEFIKKNITEDTILICIKQSIKCFDMIADFHVSNFVHDEKYNYNEKFCPINLYIHHRRHKINECHNRKFIDINYFLLPMYDIEHKRKNGWKLLKTNIDFLTLDDSNLGQNNNMVINEGHIMMELALPLAISLGCKTIILNGFVGGYTHGIHINNEINPDILHAKLHHFENTVMIPNSAYLDKYLYDNFNAHIYSICDTHFKIPKISYNDYGIILSKKS